MTRARYILAIDQGTTGTTALLVDGSGRTVWQTNQEITQIYPQPGWVEHDPEELFDSCLSVMHDLLEETATTPQQIVAMGISNQRETTLVWDRTTGVPVHNAIVWQCRRSTTLCNKMKEQGLEATVRAKTGLPIDAYFSATKLRWILDAIPYGQQLAEKGDLVFGTVDSWLLWKLTNGTVHATDVSNASRTMLFNIDDLQWDSGLTEILDIPTSLLPEVRPSSGIFGQTSHEMFEGTTIPIAGVVGDQHASLFGQGCCHPGMAKNTYGTGSFMMSNTAARRVQSKSGMISTIAWQLGNEVTYALEGSIFATGSTIQWLRDGLGLIAETSDVDALAKTVPDNGGVYLVPAFTGLGAPHWDMNARGAVLGITRGTNSGHFARAALESTAYQTRDVVDAMSKDTGQQVPLLRVDGGGTASELMMQFQADILGIPIERSAVSETTALGAAYLAGLAVGFWNDLTEIVEHWRSDTRFEPKMQDAERQRLYTAWKCAIGRTQG